MKPIFCAIACGLSLAGWCGTALTVAEARRRAFAGETVEFAGQIVCEADDRILVEDDTGGVLVSRGNSAWKIGDSVRIVAHRLSREDEDPAVSLISRSIETVNRGGSLRPPPEIGPADMRRIGELAYRRVRITGRVTDAFTDEIDPEWAFLILEDAGERAVIAVHGGAFLPRVGELTGAVVAVTGIFMPQSGGGRTHLGPYVVDHYGTGIAVVEPAPADPFRAAVPLELDVESVGRAVRSGRRFQVDGTVVAVWNGNSFFLRTDDDRRIRVCLAKGVAAPAPGARVRAIGFVRSSIFFARLANALVRPAEGGTDAADPVEDVDARRILSDGANRRRIRSTLDGRLVRLRGRVTDVFRDGGGRQRLALDCEDTPVTVLADGVRPPEISSVVEATGACLITEDPDAGDREFVRLSGFMVVLRGPDDLRTVAAPPWWTAPRLLVLVGALLLLVVAAAAWNVFLRRLVARRTEELVRESRARLEADLRVDERMRLAVELHDSIVQDFTGVTLQLEAVAKAHAAGSPRTGQIIAAARRMVDSCCAELRGCLWDLRNASFDGADVAAAVRTAVEPHLGGAEATVEADVPRGRIPDTTFHALLSIVRELTANAVRHGGARHVAIRAALEGDTLRLVVKDDGRGFDPARRPGAAEGHFGIRGIEERLERLGGGMEIVSRPGAGAEFRIGLEI